MSQKKVSIVTITYNQEGVISQTLDAILSQKTQFDFELIIGEDCSTDNTLEIVLNYRKRYPKIIKVITSDSNVGIEKNYLRCYKACNTEYVAICDGDDYWIDPLKLQKQVDFLEEHKDFGLIGTMVDYFDAGKKRITKGKRINKEFIEHSFENLFIENPLTSSTVLFKGELLTQFLKLYKNNKEQLDGFIDYSLWMFFANKMKVAELKDVTCMYRISDNNISRNEDFKKAWQYRRRNYRHFKFFTTYIKDLPQTVVDQAYYKRALWYYRLVGVNRDEEVFHELQDVLKHQKDYCRYFLLKLIFIYPKSYHLANLYEKVKARISKIFSI